MFTAILVFVVGIISLFACSPKCHTYSTRCGCIEKVGKITCDGMDTCPYEACDHMVAHWPKLMCCPVLFLLLARFLKFFVFRLAKCVIQTHIGAGNAAVFIPMDQALKSDALEL
jgi:hypothetical protein